MFINKDSGTEEKRNTLLREITTSNFDFPLENFFYKVVLTQYKTGTKGSYHNCIYPFIKKMNK